MRARDVNIADYIDTYWLNLYNCYTVFSFLLQYVFDKKDCVAEHIDT